MNDVQRLIHTAEFSAHLALHVASPFWLHVFENDIPPKKIAELQNWITSGKGVLSSEEVESFTRQYLGEAAVGWMWRHFISTVEPRVHLQQEILIKIVRPIVSPRSDPGATTRLSQASDDTLNAKLDRFDRLMGALYAQPDDPRDSDFIEAARSLISPLNPTRRLEDSLYLTLLAPILDNLRDQS